MKVTVLTFTSVIETVKIKPNITKIELQMYWYLNYKIYALNLYLYKGYPHTPKLHVGINFSYDRLKMCLWNMNTPNTNKSHIKLKSQYSTFSSHPSKGCSNFY